ARLAVDPSAGAGYSPPLLPHRGPSMGEHRMSSAGALLLTLAMAVHGADPAAPDLPRLREMLYDRQAPLQQSQAALLLVAAPDAGAAEVVRRGLRQTDSVEVFLALSAALRTARDGRFCDELLSALAGPRPNVR